jgi:plasmid maintenance system antidote protein VapI
MSRVHRALSKVVMEAKAERSLTQQQIADLMGVDKSVVSRIINGESNLTLKTIGDISWVVGLKPELTFKVIDRVSTEDANNIAMPTIFAAQSETPRVETSKPIEIGMGGVISDRRTGSSGQPIKHISAEKFYAD